MFQHPLTFGIHDVCGHIYFQTRCDGTLNEDEDPLLFCGISTTTLRKTVDEGEQQESPNPSSTTGKNCLFRAAVPTPSDCFIDKTTCGLENIKLWSWLGLEAPDIDEDTGEYCGFEEIVSATSECRSCGKEASACGNKVAYATLHNVWCNRERHPTWPYGIMFYPSLETVLTENEMAFGQGFTSFRDLSFRLKRNPNFVDPWGIMEDQGTNSKYKFKLLKCPPESTVEELVDLVCACVYCNSDDQLLVPDSMAQKSLVGV